MTQENEDEAARRSLMDTINRILADEDRPTAEPAHRKIRPRPTATPTPKPPPALRAAPRSSRPTDEPIARRPPSEGPTGPTRYVPPADGLLGGTQRKKSK